MRQKPENSAQSDISAALIALRTTYTPARGPRWTYRVAAALWPRRSRAISLQTRYRVKTSASRAGVTSSVQQDVVRAPPCRNGHRRLHRQRHQT